MKAPNAPDMIKVIKADRLQLQRYKIGSTPELATRYEDGHPWASIVVTFGDIHRDLTNAEKHEAEAYMLKRIRLALVWLEIMEQTGMTSDAAIETFTPLVTTNLID